MERIVIEDIFDIAEIMHDMADDGKHVGFVGYYEDVVALIKDLVMFDDVMVEYIDISPVNFDGYDREYYVDLDLDKRLCVEKGYDRENEIYKYGEADVLLIADDCNSKILDRIDYKHAFEVGYELDEPECDGDCGNCKVGEPDKHEVITRVATDDNGKLRGFEKSWETKEDGMTYHSTYSFFSSDEKMLKDMLDNFKIKY